MNINYNHNKLERFIPITFIELENELSKLNYIEAEKLKRLGEFIRTHYHTKFHKKLLELKTNYHSFNPDRDTITLQNHDTNMDNISKQFIDNIKELLNNANYELLTQDEIALAINETSPYGVEVNVDLNNFDELLLFFRGSAIKTDERRTLKSLFLKKEVIETFIYRRLFLLFKQNQNGKELIYLKLFKDIPQSDLEMLFPNIKVKIALMDKIKLFITGGGGTVAGGMSLFGKLALTLEPMALLSAIGAFGAIITRQVSSIFNHRTKYMAKLTKNLYYYNLDNNAGAITYILDMAEDEEAKEVLLAYIFLLEKDYFISKDQLDKNIESFIDERFKIPMDFEIDDALEKLIELDFVEKKDNLYKAKSLSTKYS